MASDSRVCFAQKKEKKEIVVSRKSRQLLLPMLYITRLFWHTGQRTGRLAVC